MRTKNDVKILLCYILKCIAVPISKTSLELLFQNTALANFFEVGDALSSLNDAGLLSVTGGDDGDVYYSLTDEGVYASDNLETDIPLSTRRLAVNAALEIIAKEKTKRYTEAKIEKLNKGYHVILSIKDGDTVMMQTVLYAADSIQANAVCDSFTADPSKLYSGIIDILTR